MAVPDFPAGAAWFNAPPLRLDRELRGKVVLLDLWTYCCVNCLHVLPDLAFLERKFEGRPLAVVGVHSAKFDNEKDDEAIRSAGAPPSCPSPKIARLRARCLCSAVRAAPPAPPASVPAPWRVWLPLRRGRERGAAHARVSSPRCLALPLSALLPSPSPLQ